MIQPNELRIGNLVIFPSMADTDIGHVAEILADGITYHDGGLHSCSYDDIYPIELTPERMGWLGMERCDEHGLLYETYIGTHKLAFVFNHTFNWYDASFGTESNSVKMPSIQYVHELQNLYYLFTGDELEVSSS